MRGIEIPKQEFALKYAGGGRGLFAGTTVLCVSVTLLFALAVRSTCMQTTNISQHFVNAS